MKRRICILGTYHAYQYLAPRDRYRAKVKALIRLHSVDLVAEEATAKEGTTFYAKELTDECKLTLNRDISWENVDLTKDERGEVEDGKTLQIEPFIDSAFETSREWIWVERVSKKMKNSALLICGFAHTFSVSEKFRWAGFEVETHTYFDPQDHERIKDAR
jgi:hypothetical protein